MKRLSILDMQELSVAQVEVPLIKSEQEMEAYYGRLQNKIGTFITQGKGIFVDINGQLFSSKQGGHNLFFCKEECLGRDIFLKNDTLEVITIAVSEAEFSQMAEKYPDTFKNIYERYQKGGNFLLNNRGSFCTSMQMQAILQQLDNTQLLGKAAGAYADLKVLELFLLQLQQMEVQKYQAYQYCKTHTDIDKIHEVS